LADLGLVLGLDRSIVIARELTKLYEEFWRGTISQAIALYQNRAPQGEYTLLLAGKPPSHLELTEAQIKAELLDLIKAGVSRSQASRELAQDTGLSRRYLYQLALGVDFHGDESE
jgi:16S rRNA (cytidine1402-2'-O)-methyltransferase